MNPETTHAEKSNPQLKSANQPKYSLFTISLIVIPLALLAFLIIPIIRTQILTAKKSESINNIRQIGQSLSAFEDEYRSFPSKETIAIIEAKHPDHGLNLSGDSSNALLRQLYADTGSSPEGLKKGKFHYAYISNLSAGAHPLKPILFGPVIPGTKKIDTKALDDRAVVLRADGSVSLFRINKKGQIIGKHGNILSPEHPYWNGKTPTIHYPE